MRLLAEQNRAFGYAAAASVALHALFLAIHAPVSRPPQREPPEPPLVAHLVEPPPPAPPAPVVQTPAAPKPVAKSKAKPKPLARPAPRPVAPREQPAAEEKAEEQAEEQAEEKAEEKAQESITPPAPASSPAPPVVAVAPRAPPAPDPAAILAGFRRQLVDAAVRYKRYPRIALDNGWSGDVAVRIEVDARGAVSSIKVKTSSGHEVLDQQALEMFRKAAAEVPVPAALRGQAFPVEVRAIYNLQDRPG